MLAVSCKKEALAQDGKDSSILKIDPPIDLIS
jgi:hypothetical protein